MVRKVNQSKEKWRVWRASIVEIFYIVARRYLTICIKKGEREFWGYEQGIGVGRRGHSPGIENSKCQRPGWVHNWCLKKGKMTGTECGEGKKRDREREGRELRVVFHSFPMILDFFLSELGCIIYSFHLYIYIYIYIYIYVYMELCFEKTIEKQYRKQGDQV